MIDLMKETRPDGFNHDQLVARVAEMGHPDPVTEDEAEATIEQANNQAGANAVAFLEHAANLIGREIADARSLLAEDDDGYTLSLIFRATEIEQLRDGLRTVATSMRGDLILRGILRP
jgi:hypothetical protein